jgi:hypothetical protein
MINLEHTARDYHFNLNWNNIGPFENITDKAINYTEILTTHIEKNKLYEFDGKYKYTFYNGYLAHAYLMHKNKTTRLKDGDILIYRGQRTDYPIRARIYRPEYQKILQIIKTKYQIFGKIVADYLDHVSTDFYLTVFNKEASIKAFAQHYGLATDLIDWTLDPMVALHFATEGVSVNDIGNERIVYELNLTKAKNLGLKIIIPPVNCKNLFYQRALFIVDNNHININEICTKYVIKDTTKQTRIIRYDPDNYGKVIHPERMELKDLFFTIIEAINNYYEAEKKLPPLALAHIIKQKKYGFDDDLVPNDVDSIMDKYYEADEICYYLKWLCVMNIKHSIPQFSEEIKNWVVSENIGLADYVKKYKCI